MSETTRESATKANKCQEHYSDVRYPTWEELVEQDRAEKRAAEAAKQSQTVAATVIRLIEENRTQRKAVTAKQYTQATKFQVGSEIDEAGLSAIEFRIYAHLVRRADRNGECFPSIGDICRYCQCRRTTAIEAIRVLENKKLVSSQRRHHKPTVYTLRPAQDWCDLKVE